MLAKGVDQFIGRPEQFAKTSSLIHLFNCNGFNPWRSKNSHK
jgi:hypothetical protein